MIIDLIAIIAFIIVFSLIIFFIYLKDKEMNKKLSIYEKAIEDLNKRIFLLEKNQKKMILSQNTDIEHEIKKIENSIKFRVEEAVVPLTKSIKDIQWIVNKFQNEIDSRIENLEVLTKEMNSLISSGDKIDENKIIELYKEGMNIDEIAKMQKISQGKVDLVLKLANLKI